jgi:hypothetical protein
MAHRGYKKPIRNEPREAVTCWVSRIGDRSWDLDYAVRAGRVEFRMSRTTQVSDDSNTRSTVRIFEKLRKRPGKYAGKPLKFTEVAKLRLVASVPVRKYSSPGGESAKFNILHRFRR